MKIFFTSVLLLAMAVFSVIAQEIPAGFNYQGIARDADGQILQEQALVLRTSILFGEEDSLVYQETHMITTNQFGLFNLVVGEGILAEGSFGEIEWGTGTYYLQLEIQEESSYSLLGVSRLLSVPYALYAVNGGGSSLWQQSANGLYTMENVGIKNEEPASELDVIGDISASGNIVATGGNSANWNEAYTYSQIGHVEKAGDVMEGDLIINSSLGINTNPLYRLDISDTIPQLRLIETLSGGSRRLQIRVGYNEQINFYTTYGSNGNFPFTFSFGGSTGEAFRINTDGNVGIGTPEPARKLHVSDAMRLEPLDAPPSNPEMGDMYMGTDGKLHIYNGTEWKTVMFE